MPSEVICMMQMCPGCPWATKLAPSGSYTHTHTHYTSYIIYVHVYIIHYPLYIIYIYISVTSEVMQMVPLLDFGDEVGRKRLYSMLGRQVRS